MVDIVPHYGWREEYYISEEDEKSPFHGVEYDDMPSESHMIYNYFIHPQWDYFDADTLYLKVLSADYTEGVAIIEFIGEWNDTIGNDVMYLKRKVIEPLMDAGISKFILIVENVLNFHGDDDEYYAEWAEDARDSFNGGWIAFLNTFDHVADEMHATRLDDYAYFGQDFNGINWRQQTPKTLVKLVENRMTSGVRKLR